MTDNKPQRPHRAYELDIHIGGDTWSDVLADLRYLANHIEDHGEKCGSVMGGPSSNHIVTIIVRPEMTHERYISELDAYLTPQNAPTTGDGGQR